MEKLRDRDILVEVVVEDPAARNQMWQTFVGLDTLDRSGGIMFDEYKEKRYASPPLLKRMVSLGQERQGFYAYSGEKSVPCRWCERRAGSMMD